MHSKADLHIHTGYSIDSMSRIKNIVEKALHEDIKIIAITDHDTIEGALKTQEYVKQNNIPLQVIVGEEISSLSGHVIGLFLKEPVPPFLSLEETVSRIKQQGGLVIIPHLSFAKRIGTDRPLKFRVNYKKLLDSSHILEKIDAIEIANFTMFDKNLTPNVQKHAHKFNKALVAGSDAHISPHIGISHTVFPGETIDDLKIAIILKKTKHQTVREHTFLDIISHHLSATKIPFAFIYYFFKRAAKKTVLIFTLFRPKANQEESDS